MAAHSFTKSYKFISMKGQPYNNGQDYIVDEVIVEITGVDKADNTKTKTITEILYFSPFERAKNITSENWTTYKSVTPSQVETWAKDLIEKNADYLATLEAKLTVELYGVDELDA
mgnify:CR=1 FL=1|tara:strand:+ start:1257 stop:1601 length:345 start_codon:yes stop_codon:yes gene_type:complete